MELINMAFAGEPQLPKLPFLFSQPDLITIDTYPDPDPEMTNKLANLIYHQHKTNATIWCLSIALSVLFLWWVSSVTQTTALAQHEQHDYEYENSRDIARVQENIRGSQSDITQIKADLKDIRDDVKQQRTALDQIRGGVYIFVPLLGLLNIFGFIRSLRDGGVTASAGVLRKHYDMRRSSGGGGGGGGSSGCGSGGSGRNRDIDGNVDDSVHTNSD